MKTALVGTLMLSAACALNPAPVPVSGAAEDVKALVGDWTGQYRSPETGRSGSILFMLEAWHDTAHGDVVMVTREANMTFDDATSEATRRRAANQVLTIRFVRVNGSLVTGTIDPYPAPDCTCDLVTVFHGRLRENRIEGTFRSHHTGHDMPVQEGTWWVTRTPSQPR